MDKGVFTVGAGTGSEVDKGALTAGAEAPTGFATGAAPPSPEEAAGAPKRFAIGTAPPSPEGAVAGPPNNCSGGVGAPKRFTVVPGAAAGGTARKTWTWLLPPTLPPPPPTFGPSLLAGTCSWDSSCRPMVPSTAKGYVAEQIPDQNVSDCESAAYSLDFETKMLRQLTSHPRRDARRKHDEHLTVQLDFNRELEDTP